jgi:hypothetical protein
MILKEWRCDSHGDFEAMLGICSCCGRKATRVFLSPPRIQTGMAKRVDRTLSREFERRGITNFSNSGGVNKFTQGRRPDMTYASGNQAGVTAIWGSADLHKYGLNPAALTVNGAPISLEQRGAEEIKMGDVLPDGRDRAAALRAQTTIIAAVDHKGNEVPVSR